MLGFLFISGIYAGDPGSPTYSIRRKIPNDIIGMLASAAPLSGEGTPLANIVVKIRRDLRSVFEEKNKDDEEKINTLKTDWKSKNDLLENSLAALKAQLSNLQSDLSTTQADNTKLIAKNSTFESKNERLTTDLDDLNKAMRDLTDKTSEDLQNLKDAQQTELARINAILAADRVENTRLQTELSEATKLYDEQADELAQERTSRMTAEENLGIATSSSRWDVERASLEEKIRKADTAREEVIRDFEPLIKKAEKNAAVALCFYKSFIEVETTIQGLLADKNVNLPASAKASIDQLNLTLTTLNTKSNDLIRKSLKSDFKDDRNALEKHKQGA